MNELPEVSRVGVSAVWHASPTKTAAPFAHLMPTQWAADGRKSRPALCGQRRIRWASATTVDRDLIPCDGCLTEAEKRQPIGALVRIAPRAQRVEDLPGRVVEPMQPNTVLDRLRRRLAFRDELVVLSERAERYLAEQRADLFDRRRRASLVAAPALPEPAEPGPDESPDLSPHAPLLAYSSG